MSGGVFVDDILRQYVRLGRPHVCSSFLELLYALLAAPAVDLDSAKATQFAALASSCYCAKCFHGVHELALRFIVRECKPNALTSLLLMACLSNTSLTSWWSLEPQWRFTALAHGTTCAAVIRDVFRRFGLLLDDNTPAGTVYKHYRDVCRAKSDDTALPALSDVLSALPNDANTLLDTTTGINAVGELLQFRHRFVLLGSSRSAADAALRDVRAILNLGNDHAAVHALEEALCNDCQTQELAGLVLMAQPGFPLSVAATWHALPCLLQHADVAQMAAVVERGHFAELASTLKTFAGATVSCTKCHASDQEARRDLCWACHFTRCAPLNHDMAMWLMTLSVHDNLPKVLTVANKAETERVWRTPTPRQEQLNMLCSRLKWQ